MDQSEPREDGAPPSTTTDRPKAQRPDPGPDPGPGTRPDPGTSTVSFSSEDCKGILADFKRETSSQLEPAGDKWLTPGLRKYFVELSLDPNTAQRKLKLSENNKKVTRVREDQPYPHHQDRFEFRPQLLCSTGLTGRCYWEVQWSGRVFISVSYRGIKRKGNSVDCVFGQNDQYWSLFCSEGRYYVCHNHNHTLLPQYSSSSCGTVAVYVDCPAGSLSFYTVSSDYLTHLHTFNTTFSQPLVPGFSLFTVDSSVSLCPL